MRNFIIGLILGMVLVSIAWAAERICIVDDNNNVLGTTAYPLNITNN